MIQVYNIPYFVQLTSVYLIYICAFWTDRDTAAPSRREIRGRGSDRLCQEDKDILYIT